MTAFETSMEAKFKHLLTGCGLVVLCVVYTNCLATPPVLNPADLPVSALTTTVISNATSGLSPVTKTLSGVTSGANATPIMTLTQTAATGTRAISVIDWTSFNIGSAAKVVFAQPSVSSVVLNRVTGSTATRIDGSLVANGQVWLLNGNGVMVGPNGNVYAAGFLAGTAGITDTLFVNGFSTTNIGSSTALGHFSFTPSCAANCTTLSQILNQGSIQTSNGGYVLLGAEQVRNEGLIQADLGLVGLGAGKAFTISFAGDRTLQFASVDQDVQLIASNTTSNLFTSSTANGSDALLSNPGKLIARGGKVAMYAATALGVVQRVINTSGLINADTARVDSAGNVFFTNSDSLVSTATGNTVNTAPITMSSFSTMELHNGSVELVGMTSAKVINGDVVNSGTIRANANFVNDASTVFPNSDQTIIVAGGTVSNTGVISANSVWIDPLSTVSNTYAINPSLKYAALIDLYGVHEVQNAGTISANSPLGTALVSLISPLGNVSNASSGHINAEGFDGGLVDFVTSSNGVSSNVGAVSVAAVALLNSDVATSGSAATGLTEVPGIQGMSAYSVLSATPNLLSIFSTPYAGLAGTFTTRSLATGATDLLPLIGSVPAASSSSTATATASAAVTTAVLKQLAIPTPPPIPVMNQPAPAPVAQAPQPNQQPAPPVAAQAEAAPVPKDPGAPPPPNADNPGASTANAAPAGSNPNQPPPPANPPGAVAQNPASPGPSTAPAANAPPPPPQGNSGNAAGMPPSPSAVGVALAKASGQAVANVSPATVAATPVAPAPPSPVGDTKPPTPKDAADSGDKTLATATASSPAAVTAPKRAPGKTNTVQVGMVGIQTSSGSKPPVASAQEQRFSQIGNSAAW